MRVFITGGTGFLGRAVVDACLSAGHEVIATVRSGHHRLPAAVQAHAVPLADPELLAPLLKGVDAVLHLAGKVSRDPLDGPEMHAIHVEATQKLLNACETAGVRRFILASTSGTVAVSKEKRRPATEEDEAELTIIGKWPYYTSKRLQEQEVLRRDKTDKIEAIILNPSLLLGPGDERLSSTTDVLNVLNRRVPALTEGTMALVDVRDCAPVFVRALTEGQRGQRYLLNGSNMSVRSFVERVSLLGNVGMPKLTLKKTWALKSAQVLEAIYSTLDRSPPIDAVSVDMGSHHWGCDAQKAKKVLGFTPRDPQATLQATVDYLIERGLFRRP